MGVADDLRLQVRWAWHRATFVAQTEGLKTLAQWVAAELGLDLRRTEPEELLAGPPRAPLTARSAQAWPVSLILLVEPEAGEAGMIRARQLTALAHRLGVPARTASYESQSLEVANALQLSSHVLCVGGQAWPEPAVHAEARRLRLAVGLSLDDADLADAHCHGVARTADFLVVTHEEAAAAVRRRWPDVPQPTVVGDSQDESALSALNALLMPAVRAAR